MTKRTKLTPDSNPASKPKPLTTRGGSPVFVARFADGEVTRMSIFHSADRESFDLPRAVRVSRDAYEVRKRQPAPAIVEGSFINPVDGTTLKTYTPEELVR
jgi:hypothetical protein